MFTIQLGDFAHPASDILGDGDPDLFIGRPSSGASYFYQNTARQSLTATPPKWLGVRLTSSNLQNRNGLGATVKVVAAGAGSPDLTGFRQYGGQSGAAPSDAGFLTFGLGQAQNGADVTVTWPDGSTKDVTVIQADLNQVITIDDDHDPGAVSNLGLGIVAVPPSSADWVFTWLTDNSADPALDKITVRRENVRGGSCTEFSDMLIEAGSPDVTVEVTRAANGKYRHTLTWDGPACEAPCKIYYSAESGTGWGLPVNSNEALFTIPSCIN